MRFLENVGDAELCRLYQTAGWSIYPSLYEGFGFPILDSLRHGTPVLSSFTSSMAEFDHPGVFFFDPHDLASVDRAWQRFEEATPPTISRARLDELYSWDRVARAVLDAHAQSISAFLGARSSARAARCIEHEFSGVQLVSAGAGSLVPFSPGPASTTASRVRQHAGPRIGIGLFGTQTASPNRGIGRFSRSLVTALLTRDDDMGASAPGRASYVLYGWRGLPTERIPAAPNAVVRTARARRHSGRANFDRRTCALVATNPDGLDALLLVNALGMAPACDLPAQPSNGMKLAAMIYELMPVVLDDDCPSGLPVNERMKRHFENLGRLASYDALLAVSEPARRDLVSILRVSPDRIVNIGTASDARFFVPDRSDPIPSESRALFQKLGITGPFVLSVGSMDDQHRDSLRTTIEAFAMLPVELRTAHQLVCTYALSSEARERVRRCAVDRGIADRLVITDRLADKALRLLYQRCAAFVSVTSYEELGMPVLEAMSCRAPVVAGKSAAQLELIGDAGLYFNVTDATELADRLITVLGDSAQARQLGERGLVQAARFRWNHTADKVLDVLTGSHAAERACAFS